MNILELMHHPELLNRETLYELREMTAMYPYYQPARLLMLKNLYILHDPTFDEELRRSAVFFTDRRILFNIVEAAHYKLKKRSAQSFNMRPERRYAGGEDEESRTVSLIDNFLSTIPEDEKEKEAKEQKKERKHRKPTAADATVDYMAYLLATDFEELNNADGSNDNAIETASTMKGGSLIDNFINNEGGKITLQDVPEYLPEMELEDNSVHAPETELITETMASIYVKQKEYTKALDVMTRIKESKQKKGLYFDDQERFLKKLILATKKTN